MNFKCILVVGLLVFCAFESLDAKKSGKSKKAGKKGLSKGKSGRPRLRSSKSKMNRGSVQGMIDTTERIMMRCQYLERNFGEGAAGIQIRKCKVKRPYKKRVALTCEFGDFLCARCEMAKCASYQKNKKVFLYQLAKKVIAGVKQDPYTKDFYCSAKPVAFEDDSCSVEFPFSSNYVPHNPNPKTTVMPTTTTTTTTTTEYVHPNCEDDPNQQLCNSFMSWNNFIFNKPFEKK